MLDPAPDTADSDKKKISFAVPDSEKDKEREQKEKESKEDKKRIPDDSLATERRMKRVQMSSPELARKSPDVARKSPPPASARSPSPVRAVDEEQGGSGRKTRYQVFFFFVLSSFSLCFLFFFRLILLFPVFLLRWPPLSPNFLARARRLFMAFASLRPCSKRPPKPMRLVSCC